ncbi:hypothetical protein G7085_12155 [Tessaracoccus sp. HDW20]|uniref:hypothetical protein n=1 Tax=Tessaracoccus coleopterorum TaxID=2714950 RepID=UPI0018D2EDB1|nr:hypothetical protein [Tessaracoccus coleopterorum]NHB85117.1 hypothetical protein [Tessaracoccus coleopterorum]
MDLYFGPTGEGSFSATVMGTIKTALRLAGVIEHSTLSAPLTQPSAALLAHVEAHLAAYPPEFN